MKAFRQAPLVSFADVSVLLHEFKAHELEFQYDAFSDEALVKIEEIFGDLDREQVGALRCVGKSGQTRPISCYYDNKNLALADTGITLRVRYGGHSFNPMSGLKIELFGSKIFQHFSTCAGDLTGAHVSLHVKNRLELEEDIVLSRFAGTIKEFLATSGRLLKEKFDKPLRKRIKLALGVLRTYLENKMGTKPLAPIFVTDAARKCFDIVVKVDGKEVGMEVALDRCRYFDVTGKKLWVPDDASEEERKHAVLHHPHDIDGAVVNGEFLMECPQVEFEYKEKLSKGCITKEDIIKAEKILADYIREKLGADILIPKDLSKGGYGYFLMQEKRQKNKVVIDFQAAAKEVEAKIEKFGQNLACEETKIRRQTIGFDGEESGGFYETRILSYIQKVKQLQLHSRNSIRSVANEITKLAAYADNLAQQEKIDRLFLSLADNLEPLGLRASKKRAALLVDEEARLVEWDTNGLCPGLDEKTSYYVKGENGGRGQWIRCAEMRVMAKYLGMRVPLNKKRSQEQNKKDVERFVKRLKGAMNNKNHGREAALQGALGTMKLYASDVPCMLCNDLLIGENQNGDKALLVGGIVAQFSDKSRVYTGSYRDLNKSIERFNGLPVSVLGL